jgi:hypothetical protein
MKLLVIINVDLADQLQIRFVYIPQTLEKEWEYSETVHQLSIDEKKARHSVRKKYSHVRWYQKVPEAVYVTTSVKEDWGWEEGAKSHFHKPIASVCHVTQHYEHTILFYTSAIPTLCFVLYAVDGKFKQRFCIKFCVKLSKSSTETHEMLLEAFGEHSLSWRAVSEWHSHFKAGRVSLEDDKCSERLVIKSVNFSTNRSYKTLCYLTLLFDHVNCVMLNLYNLL